MEVNMDTLFRLNTKEHFPSGSCLHGYVKDRKIIQFEEEYCSVLEGKIFSRERKTSRGMENTKKLIREIWNKDRGDVKEEDTRSETHYGF